MAPSDAAYIGQWMSAVADWRDAVQNCPGMVHPPEPAKFIGQVLHDTLPVARDKLLPLWSK